MKILDFIKTIKTSPKKFIIAFIIIIFIVIILPLLLSKKQPPETKTPSEQTIPFSDIPLKDRQQTTEDDKAFNEALEKIHSQSPWLKQLPIKTNNYKIVYDFNKQAFRIHLLTTSTEEIKQQALQSLKDIGVDTQTQDYYFLEPTSSFQQLIQE